VPSRWALTTALCVLVTPAAVLAQPGLVCHAERAGERAWVAVTLTELLDAELLRLMSLGMPGRLRLELAIYRRRGFWFDALVAQETRVVNLAWSRPANSLLLDGLRAAEPRRLELPPTTLRPRAGPLPAAGHYVTVSARLEVVTAASLGAVARWLVSPPRGEGEDAQNGGQGRAPAGRASLMSRVLVEHLAADLARTASGQCPITQR